MIFIDVIRNEKYDSMSDVVHVEDMRRFKADEVTKDINILSEKPCSLNIHGHRFFDNQGDPANKEFSFGWNVEVVCQLSLIEDITERQIGFIWNDLWDNSFDRALVTTYPPSKTVCPVYLMNDFKELWWTHIFWNDINAVSIKHCDLNFFSPLNRVRYCDPESPFRYWVNTEQPYFTQQKPDVEGDYNTFIYDLDTRSRFRNRNKSWIDDGLLHLPECNVSAV